MRPAAAWHWLTDPPPSVSEPEQRRRTHLLLSILVIIWVMWVFYLLTAPLQFGFAREEARSGGPTTVVLFFHIAAAAPMALAYLLGRRGHYLAAARILVTTASSAAFMEIMISGGIRLIHLPSVAIVLCSIFLSAWDTVATWVITVAGYPIFSAMAPSASSWDLADPILVATVVGGCALAAAVLRDRDFLQIEGQIVELTGIQERVLEERKMEAVARLSSGMAHEFNNILMAMSANAQVIERTTAGAALESAVRIQIWTARAARIVAGLLSLSEQQLLRPAIVDMDAVLREHESALRAPLRKTTTLLLRPGPEQKLLNIDTVLFCEAIGTLVCDVEKDISGPGTITIQTKKEDLLPSDELFFPGGSYCAMTISSGIFPKPDSGESVAFGTLQKTGNSAAGSIDLAAAHGVVRQSGGRIETKIDPELGAAFVVVVPIYEEPAAGSTTDETAKGQNV